MRKKPRLATQRDLFVLFLVVFVVALISGFFVSYGMERAFEEGIRQGLSYCEFMNGLIE